MPIDPSIPLSTFANAPSIGASYARAAQLKSLRLRQQMEQMQFDEAQKKLAEEDAYKAAAAGAVTPQQTQQVNIPGASLSTPNAAPQSGPIPLNQLTQAAPVQLPGNTDSLTSPASFDPNRMLSNLAANPKTASMVPQFQSQMAQTANNQADAKIKTQQMLANLQESMGKLDAQSRATFSDATEQVARASGAVLNAPPEARAQVYQQAMQGLAQSPNPMVQKMIAQAPQQYQPGMEPYLQEQLSHAMAIKDVADRVDQKPLKPTPGVEVPFSPEVQAQKIAIAQASKAKPAAGSTESDPKDIAAGIIRGELPPTTKGLYRNAGPVLAELGRQGFNLQRAESDWNAVQKHIGTLNGSQQERLRQSITSASDMVDKVDQLYSEWKQVGAESGIKVFNRASLAVAKNLPGRAGAVAQALDAQIADLTADLGNIYMGGNSPTERALELAGKSLQSDWNDQTFTEGVKQIRSNVKIRYNSIINSQPAGTSGQTNYGGQGMVTAPLPGTHPFFNQLGGTVVK